MSLRVLFYFSSKFLNQKILNTNLSISMYDSCILFSDTLKIVQSRGHETKHRNIHNMYITNLETHKLTLQLKHYIHKLTRSQPHCYLEKVISCEFCHVRCTPRTVLSMLLLLERLKQSSQFTND